MNISIEMIKIMIVR